MKILGFIVYFIFLALLVRAYGNFLMERNTVSETELIARTLYHEAASEPICGIQAVASVIWNRAKGKEFTQVILKPYQFSCWNDQRRENRIPPTPKAAICRNLAQEMVTGQFEPTGPWNHYYNPNLCSPSWGRQMREVKVIGNHRFGVL